MRLPLRFPGNALDPVRIAVSLLFLVFDWCSILALVIVDIAAKFETKITLSRGGGSGAVGSWERLARCNGRLWPGLEGLQSSRGIGDDAEMACERRTDVGWAGLGVDLGMSMSDLANMRNSGYSPGN